MRLFVNKIICFILVPFFLFVFTFLVNSKKIKNYKFDSSINKIVIGDSHTQTAISDSILCNTTNLSNTNENYFYTYYKLLILLDKNPQVDTVFIGVSYHSFSNYGNGALYSQLYRYIYFLPTGILFHLVSDPFSDKLSGQYLLFIQKTLTYPFLKDTRTMYGFYLPHTWEDTATEKEINKRINIQYYNKDKIHGFSEMNIEYFNKIVLLCKKKNKTLIGLNTPLHKYYTAQVPVIFKKKFRQVTSCINVIDFADLHLSENSFLPDGDHLTKVGAIITSNYLQSIIEKNSFK
jgi:hypothetical protein